MTGSVVEKSAGISACKLYRYWLKRTWAKTGLELCWVMLNPSTADADTDDPTIRKCIEFTRRWGYGALTVVNLYAWRATDPRELLNSPDPIGPVNDSVIYEAVNRRHVIAAWGTKGGKRAQEVLGLLGSASSVRCLAVTKDGHPKHPLYVSYATVPTSYPPMSTQG